MHDLEARDVRDRAFEPGVLVAANNERVDSLLAHGGADVVVAALISDGLGNDKPQ